MLTKAQISRLKKGTECTLCLDGGEIYPPPVVFRHFEKVDGKADKNILYFNHWCSDRKYKVNVSTREVVEMWDEDEFEVTGNEEDKDFIPYAVIKHTRKHQLDNLVKGVTI